MSATETWLLAAIIVAGISAILHLMELRSPWPRVAMATTAAAVGLIAVALFVALP